MRDTSRFEQELRLYWSVMQAGVAVSSLSEYREELSVLGLMSDWPRMRVACARGLARFDHVGRTAHVMAASTA